jgi:hypothetical protein
MLKKSILHPFYRKKIVFDHFITTLQFALIKVEEQITKPKKLFENFPVLYIPLFMTFSNRFLLKKLLMLLYNM